MRYNKKKSNNKYVMKGGALNEMHFPQDFSKTVPHLPPTSEYYYPLSGDLSYPNHLIENSSTIPVPLKGGKRKGSKTYKKKSRDMKKSRRIKGRKTHKKSSRKVRQTHKKSSRKVRKNMNKYKSRKYQKGGFITDFLPRDFVDLGRGAVSGVQTLYSGFVGKTMPYSDYPNVMNQPYLEKYPELNIRPANVNDIYSKSDNLAANV